MKLVGKSQATVDAEALWFTGEYIDFVEGGINDN